MAGEMFKLNYHTHIIKLSYKLSHPYYYPTNHTQAAVTSAGRCI